MTMIGFTLGLLLILIYIKFKEFVERVKDDRKWRKRKEFYKWDGITHTRGKERSLWTKIKQLGGK